MIYVALFEADKNGVNVIFPDFPGCTTCGDDLDEAVDMAHEALAGYVEILCEDGVELPEPTPKKVLAKLPENKGKKIINIIVEGDGTDFEEFELVMHSHLLKRIEKYSKDHGISPADFFAVAARQTLKSDIFSS